VSFMVATASEMCRNHIENESMFLHHSCPPNGFRE